VIHNYKFLIYFDRLILLFTFVLFNVIQTQMEAIYLLIFMGAVVAVGFLLAFFIAVKNGQFDDSTTPGIRMLFDTEINTEKDKRDKK